MLESKKVRNPGGERGRNKNILLKFSFQLLIRIADDVENRMPKIYIRNKPEVFEEKFK